MARRGDGSDRRGRTGDEIKAVRVSLRLNRRQFARALGVLPQRVMLAEEGAWLPPGDPVLAERIARVYGRRRAHLTLLRGGRA